MQETLYDIDGNPIAYLDTDDGNTIYLWNGIPVDYIEQDGAIYGFNGQHIGWYLSGYIYDNKGYIVGFNRKSARKLVKLSPLKSLKHLKPLKSLRQFRHFKPILRNVYSSLYLSQFLILGAK
jgi:hypothetical protein